MFERMKFSIEEHKPDARFVFLTVTYEDGTSEGVAGTAGRIRLPLAEAMVSLLNGSPVDPPKPKCAACNDTGFITHDFRDPTDHTPFKCPKCSGNTPAPVEPAQAEPNKDAKS